MNEKNELFTSTVDSLMNGMGGMLSTKTVVGEAVHIGDTIILPLVDVSFGMGAGSFSSNEKNNSAGGLGGKMSPSAVLVVQNGMTKLVNIKEQDGISKLIDMVPDILEKLFKKTGKDKVDEETLKKAGEAVDEMFSGE